MIVRNIVCPICGNETRVNNVKQMQKCEFCRRPMKVDFNKHVKAAGKKKWTVEVEPIEDYNERGLDIGYMHRTSSERK